MSAPRSMLAGLLAITLLTPALTLAQPVAPPIAAAVPGTGSSMLIVENAGQWPAAARFQVWGSPLGAGTTWLAEDGIWVVASRQVDMDQVGKEGRLDCGDPLVSLSTCPSRMVPNLPVYSSIALRLTFPGSNPDVHIEPFEALTTAVPSCTAPIWAAVAMAAMILARGLPSACQAGR